MILLDATKLTDETSLTQDEAGDAETTTLRIHQEDGEAGGEPVATETTTLAESPEALLTPVACLVRSITLDPPETCGTAIVLFVQQGTDGRCRSGFQVVRNYETSPHESEESCAPSIDNESDLGFELLGEAVAAAADMADEWIQLHSEDADKRSIEAVDFLRGWVDELDPATVTDAIFDPLPESAADTVADATPAESEQAVVETRGPDELHKPAPPAGVTDEAQRDFDERKHQLEREIAQLAVEEMQLKAAIKSNRDAASTTTEEYQEHILRGPVRLPLFDRTAATNPASQPVTLFDKKETDGEQSTAAAAGESTEAEPAPTAASEETSGKDGVGDAVAAATDESWRAVTIEELGIGPKTCKLLREEQDKPVATLGDINDFCKEYQLTDLKKIGSAKAAKIEEAMDAYWAAHPRT